MVGTVRPCYCLKASERNSFTHVESLRPEILASGEDADVRLDAAQHHSVHLLRPHLPQLSRHLRDQHGELGLGRGGLGPDSIERVQLCLELWPEILRFYRQQLQISPLTVTLFTVTPPLTVTLLARPN